MHDTASQIGQKVISIYAKPGDIIVDFGSQDFNGSLRQFAPDKAMYLGLDVEHGSSVDLVVEIGAPIPLRSAFADLVISSSQIEHDPAFWDTFLELARITKPGGIIYLNVPSNGPFHRYPKDYWRLYPDAGLALADWAKRKGLPIELVESFTGHRNQDIWNDFVAIFIRCPFDQESFQFISEELNCSNVLRIGSQDVKNLMPLPEDMRIIISLRNEIELLKTRLRDAERVEKELMLKLTELQSLPKALDALTEVDTDVKVEMEELTELNAEGEVISSEESSVGEIARDET